MRDIADMTKLMDTSTSARFFRQLAKMGITMEYINVLNDDLAKRKNLTEYLKKGCPEVRNDNQIIAPAINYYLAHTILGKDFIPPEKIAIVRKLTYSNEAVEHFAKTLPSKEVLQWLHDNCFVLIAGPPSSMSLLEIRDLNPHLFYREENGWYAKDEEEFSCKDKVTTEWLMLRKGVITDSITMNNRWEKKLLFLSKVEYAPNAPEVVWGETTYKEVRDCWLLPNIFGNTSSVTSDGDHVFVGGSLVHNGVGIGCCWGDICSSNTGVIPARKRNLNS